MMDTSELIAGEATDILVAVALGWKLWAEQRGEYMSCVWQKQGDHDPWMRARNRDDEKKRYTEFNPDDYDPQKHIMFGLPKFSKSVSDAVSALETRCKYEIEKKLSGNYLVATWVNEYAGARYGEAETLPLAACRSLLAWK